MGLKKLLLNSFLYLTYAAFLLYPYKNFIIDPVIVNDDEDSFEESYPEFNAG